MEIYNDTYTVYYHQNKINGKIYVGITKRKPNKRFGSNGCGYAHCVVFYNAIKKYGWNNFDHVVFASNLTKEEACNMETVLIKELHTTDRNYGYNVCKGGDLPPLKTGKDNYFYNKHFIRENHPFYGHKHSNETKIKMSKNHWDDSGGNNPNAKKVLCVETGKIYPSTKDAMDDTKISRNSISAVCRGEQKMVKGFHFEYIS